MALVNEFASSVATEPRWSVAGDLYAILADGARTGGQYALLEVIVAREGGPPPHTHTREDETFFVLEGEVTLEIGGRAYRASAGSLVYAPRGIEHHFRNVGDRPARLLVTIIPAGFEQFFQEVGDRLPPGASEPRPVTSPHVQKLLAVAPRYGVHIRLPT